jgi:hypothetical protein
MTIKYIRTTGLGFILWPRPKSDTLWHVDMAKAVERQGCGTVISAGFVDLSSGYPFCYGASESLSKSSFAEDSDLLAAQLEIKKP